MRLPCSRLVVVGVMALSLPACAQPKAAVVYSSWGNYAFRDEFDPHLQALGWPYEKLENTQMADLVQRLGELDVVISAGVGNLENAVDMAPYAADWLRFVQRGGLLWITDASYAPVLDLWVGRMGPDYALTSAACAFHRRDKPDPELMVFDEAAPLLHVPNELPPLLSHKANIWAHLDSWGPAWTSLVTCADDKSLMVYSDVGQGCILVSSYYSFRGAAATPVAAGLLENAWAHVQGLRSGLSLTRFQLGEATPGQHTAEVGWQFADVGDAPASFDVRLRVTAAGAETATYAAQVSVAGGGAGQPVVNLIYDLKQRGEVAFELSLGRTDQPPLTMTRRQTIPPVVGLELGNRHYYPWQGELPFRVALAPDAATPLADCEAVVLVDGTVTETRGGLQPELTMAADIGALQPGEHELLVRLTHGDAVLGEAQERFVTHPMPRVHIRPEDGTTIADGQPFFPFGWYHVSWSEGAEHRLRFLRTVAAGGFSTVHAGIKQIDEWEEFLSEAERLRVRVITEFGVDMFSVIARYRDRWPVLAWNPGDEPDGQGVEPQVMLERHNAMKDADPEVPTFMTLCVPQAYARYVHAAEVIAPDPYPIRHASASTVPVYEMLTQAHTEAWKLGRPIWAILQCFGYEDPNSWRVPTFAEVRNMTYLALLAGAKGVLYYTYFDTGFDMAKHPDLWRNMCTLPAEMKTLEPWMLSGQRENLETGLTDVFAGCWTANAGAVVCVVNTSDKESREVSLALPQGVHGQARSLFPTHPGGLVVADGKLTGALGPLEVHVYQLR